MWLRWSSVCPQCGRLWFSLWVGKIPWRRKWQPTPVLLPGKFYGQRSLVGYSPWNHKELDVTEQLHFTFFFFFFALRFIYLFFYLFIYFFFTFFFFPIPIPPPTSLSTRSLQVLPEHQVRALVSSIQPGLVICFTLDSIHVSMLFS